MIYINSDSKEDTLFEVFLDINREVKAEESLYVDDRIHILQRANDYNFNLLLMDRNNKVEECSYKKITKLEELLKIIDEI